MKYFAIFILAFLFCPWILNSQIAFSEDTINGKVSDVIRIPISINNQVFPAELEFEIEIDNITVFSPEKITDTNNIVVSNNFERVSENSYNIEFSLDKPLDTIYLTGKLLSGNDSITSIYLKNIHINGNPNPDDSIIITNNFFDLSGPYVRFINIRKLTPNPIYSGDILEVAFYNDLNSKIDFKVYNLNGKAVYSSSDNYEKGLNKIHFDTKAFTAGVYYAYINSVLGFAFKKFIIIK